MIDGLYQATMSTPLGPLQIVASDQGLREVQFSSELATSSSVEVCSDHPVLHLALQQLQRYFAGELAGFELPLAPVGSVFDRRVWTELTAIPFGHTASYAQIAARVGSPRAMRAVGAANGRNPLAVIVPCHRVIGASGKLVGYAGGLERKQWLLAHESAQLRLN